jgi:hypothetical protein
MAKRERHPREDLELTRDDVEIAMTEACALASNHYLIGTRARPEHVVDLERFSVRMYSGSLHITSLQARDQSQRQRISPAALDHHSKSLAGIATGRSGGWESHD